MSEKRTPYGKQLQFLTVCDYILVHQGQATPWAAQTIIEAKDGIEAARLALDKLETMASGGKVTTVMLSVSIVHEAA